MTLNDLFLADRPAASRNAPRTRAVAARAAQALSAATADALYAYAVTASAFPTLMALAAPHLDVFLRCLFHGKG
jgi:hypothetical protein